MALAAGGRSVAIALALAGALASLACGPVASGPAARPAPARGTIPADVGRDDRAILTGAGATFPAPLYQAWFQDYHRVAPGMKANYQAVGSGGGIQQFSERTVDFGATDLAIQDRDLWRVPGVQHLPTVLGSVVITYNLADVAEPLKFDGATLAKIWLGQITKWDDPAIVSLNPGVRLPAASIAVVSRSDSSGTTGVFTDYLSAVSPEWKSSIGVQKAVKWPVGQGGGGNAGVTNGVKQTAHSIGYIELSYALANRLPRAELKNRAGRFVPPSIEATSAAAAGVVLPDDYRVSIVNADGEAVYTIASFTYLLVHRDAESCAKAEPLVHLLWWIYHDPGAAQTATQLHYAPLPTKAVTAVERTLHMLRCEGEVILPDAQSTELRLRDVG